MKELFSMFTLGMFFGSGAILGGFLIWVLIPVRKGMMKKSEENNERLMRLLSDKNDILKSIEDALRVKQ